MRVIMQSIRLRHTLRLLSFVLCGVGACQAPLERRAASPVTSQPAHDDFSGEPLRDEEMRPFALFGEKPDREAPPAAPPAGPLQQHTFTLDGYDFDPDISAADGALVFASTRDAERADIYLKPADGAALSHLVHDPADDVQPRFSPDGARVVFASNRAGNWDLWIINRDGAGLTQITQDRTDEVAPCWSPDGTHLAFTIWGSRSRQWEIWTLELANPANRRFICHGMFPAWSPDGTRIAYQRARERGSRWFSIWTVGIQDGESRPATEVVQSELGACIAPRWSQDGRGLFYCAVAARGSRREPGAAASSQLWYVDLTSAARERLTDDQTDAYNPSAGPDNRVFFVSPRGGVENIWSTLLVAPSADSAVSHDASATVTAGARESR